MRSTTYLELHSQTTRLVKRQTQLHWLVGIAYGILTLSDAMFQKTYILDHPCGDYRSKNYNSLRQHLRDFKFELCPLHSPLLRASLLVSLPPVSNMLKFTG